MLWLDRGQRQEHVADAFSDIDGAVTGRSRLPAGRPQPHDGHRLPVRRLHQRPARMPGPTGPLTDRDDIQCLHLVAAPQPAPSTIRLISPDLAAEQPRW
jgi:hypothetical protein